MAAVFSRKLAACSRVLEENNLMHMVCLDLEGVLVPEVWIAFADAVGIPELRRTTREEADYSKLMQFRLDILAENNLKLVDIQQVVSGMNPLPGAVEFVRAVRERTQLVILSDIFEQFAKPLIEKLGWPTMLCNDLEMDSAGVMTGYKLRQENGKMKAVKAFKSLNVNVFAAGDSLNDLAMIREADAGCLFHAPENIRKDCTDIPHVDSYDELLVKIDAFLCN